MQYTLGVDIGSTTSKCIILRGGDFFLAAQALEGAGAGTGGPERAIAAVLERAGLRREEISFTLATGYGRAAVSGDAQMSELSCHARGAHFLCPEAKTVIDIGGQDAKALRLGPSGALENFVMNDKCAAGTGRFLEVMARVMEVEIDELEALGAQSQNRVDISSTCTVFAESEVISQLSQGSDRCDIIDGIHRSVAARVGSLVRRVGVRPKVFMTGGVAQNGGVRGALSRELETEIATDPLAQYAGALGAALFAWDELRKGE